MTVENSSRKPTNWKRLLIVIGGPVLLLYLAYLIFFPRYHVRYRLEFVVKDHEKIRIGTGVVEAAYQLAPDGIAVGPWTPSGAASYVYGHTVTIDLGSKGLLFAVLCSHGGNASGTIGRLPWLAYRLFPPYDSETFRAGMHQLKGKSGWVDIPAEEMPMLIRFRNIGYPLSAEKVDPKNLAAIYGDGMKLVSARLELTRDAVTPMPSNWPAWLKSLRTTYLDPGYIGGG